MRIMLYDGTEYWTNKTIMFGPNFTIEIFQDDGTVITLHHSQIAIIGTH